ncbi:hypothetical protein [Streptomyces sp. NPDC003077]|uniref:hypothetical protein n=1 Tax=Streptomyces sp. NPDC003077 TaxID=3154443 RepID=UPI0033BB97A4
MATAPAITVRSTRMRLTIVSAAALAVGRQAASPSGATGAVFVAAALAASVRRRLPLASAGAPPGRFVTGARGRPASAAVGNGVIVLPAVRRAWTATA